MWTSVAPVALQSPAAFLAPSVFTRTASSSDGLNVTNPAQLMTQASFPLSLRTWSPESPSIGSVTSPASGTHLSRRNASSRSPWRSRKGRKGGEEATLPKNRSWAVPPARGRTSTWIFPTSG